MSNNFKKSYKDSDNYNYNNYQNDYGNSYSTKYNGSNKTNNWNKEKINVDKNSSNYYYKNNSEMSNFDKKNYDEPNDTDFKEIITDSYDSFSNTKINNSNNPLQKDKFKIKDEKKVNYYNNNQHQTSNNNEFISSGFNRSGNYLVKKNNQNTINEEDNDVKINNINNIENNHNNEILQQTYQINTNYTQKFNQGGDNQSIFPNNTFQNKNHIPSLTWENRYEFYDQIKLKKLENNYNSLLEEHLINIKKKNITSSFSLKNTKEIYLYDSNQTKILLDLNYDCFSDIKDLSKVIQENVKNLLYNELTQIQKIVIPCFNKKKDIVACAETGSGKTVAYSLPILNEMIIKGPPKKLMIPSKYYNNLILNFKTLRKSISCLFNPRSNQRIS